MTQEEYPFSVAAELVDKWCDPRTTGSMHFDRYDLAARAAQWGADQELEACCEWLVSEGGFKYEHEAVEDLRAARRPKPPSLKEQALLALSHLLDGAAHSMDTTEPADYIRRALEQLPDHE
jgi:hypothetical protein